MKPLKYVLQKEKLLVSISNFIETICNTIIQSLRYTCNEIYEFLLCYSVKGMFNMKRNFVLQSR